MKIICALFWTTIVAVTVKRCWAEFLLVEVDDAAVLGARSNNPTKAHEIEKLGRQGVRDNPVTTPKGDEPIAEVRPLAEAQNLKKPEKINPDYYSKDAGGVCNSEDEVIRSEMECSTALSKLGFKPTGKYWMDLRRMPYPLDASIPTGCSIRNGGDRMPHLVKWVRSVGSGRIDLIPICKKMWSQWSQCSESCGTGFKVRTRAKTVLESGDGNRTDEEKDIQPCKIRTNHCEPLSE